MLPRCDIPLLCDSRELGQVQGAWQFLLPLRQGNGLKEQELPEKRWVSLPAGAWPVTQTV